MKIRQLEADDCAALVPLLDQLGYPSTEQAVRARANDIASDPRVGCWVAESDGQIVGLITGHLSWHIEHDGPAARLTALVVDENARGQGIARQLADVFEQWAQQNGASKATLTSSLHREDAHAAYTKLGWSTTGVRFAKDLPSPDSAVQ
jgi:GNAT superfamily N-acetyltransferase